MAEAPSLKFEINTNQAVEALKKLTAPLKEVQASFEGLSKVISTDFIKSMNSISAPFDKVAGAMEKLGSGSIKIKSGLLDAVSVLKQVSKESKDFDTVISKIGNIANNADFSNFEKVAGGLQKLGTGINELASSTNKAKGLKESVLEVSKAVQLLVSDNVTGLSRFASSTLDSFSKVTTIVSKFSNSIKKLQEVGSVGIESPNIKTMNLETSIKVVKGQFNELLNIFSGLGNKSNKIIETKKHSNGSFSIKTIQEFVNSQVRGFSEITSIFSKFSTAISRFNTNATGFKSKLKFAGDAVKDIITSLGNLGKVQVNESSRLSGQESSSKIIFFVNEQMNGFTNLVSVLNKFSRSISSLKKSTTTIKKDLTIFKTELLDLIASIGSAVLGSDKLGVSTSFSSFLKLSDALHKTAEAMKYLRATTASAGTVAERAKKVLDGVDRSSRSLTRSLNWLAGGWKSVYTAFVGGTVIYSTVRAIKDAVNAFLDLDREMRLVNVVARETESVLEGMKNTVLSVSSAYGLSSKEVATALYEINQATIVGSSALEVMRNAAKMAVAGNTDIAKSSKILAQTIKAYGKSVNESSYLTDIFFKIQERGIVTIDELAQYGGRLLATFSSAGQSVEQFGAALSTLTTRGLQANIAVTALNSLVLKLSSGNEKLNALFAKTGDYTSANALRTKGLAYTMQVLQNATGGALDALTQLGFNYRDIRAATILANDIGGTYAENMQIFANRTNVLGSAQKAYLEVAKSFSQQLREMRQALINSITSITDFIGKWSGLSTIIEIINSFVKSTNPMISMIRSVTGSVVSYVTGLSLLTLSILTVIGGIVKLKAGLVSLITGHENATKGTSVLSAGLSALRNHYYQVTSASTRATTSVNALTVALERQSIASRKMSVPQGLGYQGISSVAQNIGANLIPLKNTKKIFTTFSRSLVNIRRSIKFAVPAIKGLGLMLRSLVGGVAGLLVTTTALWGIGKAIEFVKKKVSETSVSKLAKEFDQIKKKYVSMGSAFTERYELNELEKLNEKLLSHKNILGETSKVYQNLQAKVDARIESIKKHTQLSEDELNAIRSVNSEINKRNDETWQSSLSVITRLYDSQIKLTNAVIRYNKIISDPKAPITAIMAQKNAINKLENALIKLRHQVEESNRSTLTGLESRFIQTTFSDASSKVVFDLNRVKSIFDTIQSKIPTVFNFDALIGEDPYKAAEVLLQIKNSINQLPLNKLDVIKSNYINGITNAFKDLGITVSIASGEIDRAFGPNLLQKMKAYNKGLSNTMSVFSKGVSVGVRTEIDNLVNLQKSLVYAVDQRAQSQVYVDFSDINKYESLLKVAEDYNNEVDKLNAQYAQRGIRRTEISKLLKESELAQLKNKYRSAITDILGDKYLDSITIDSYLNLDISKNNLNKAYRDVLTKFRPIREIFLDLPLEDVTYNVLQRQYSKLEEYLKTLPNIANITAEQVKKAEEAAYNMASPYKKQLLLLDKLEAKWKTINDVQFANQPSLLATLQVERAELLTKLSKVQQDITKANDSIRASMDGTLSPIDNAISAYTELQSTFEGLGLKIADAATIFNKLQEAALKGGNSFIKIRDSIANKVRIQQGVPESDAFMKWVDDLYRSGVLATAKRKKDLEKATKDYYNSLLPKPAQINRIITEMDKLQKQMVITSESNFGARQEIYAEYLEKQKQLQSLLGVSMNLAPEVKTSKAIEKGSSEAYDLIKRSEQKNYDAEIAQNTAKLLYEVRQLDRMGKSAGITIVT